MTLAKDQLDCIRRKDIYSNSGHTTGNNHCPFLLLVLVGVLMAGGAEEEVPRGLVDGGQRTSII